jgi:hypothetical protein
MFVLVVDFISQYLQLSTRGAKKKKYSQLGYLLLLVDCLIFA